MTATTLQEAPTRQAFRLPFSPRTALAVAAAAILAVVGAVWIALPKASESTDAAYLQADSATVAPRVRGLVAEVLVRHNQAVRRGDPLVRIDPEEFDAKVASAGADLANAEASVMAAQAAFVTQAADESLAAANVRHLNTAPMRAVRDFERTPEGLDLTQTHP